MEALIYDESPIAECLEADAVPFETVVPPSPTPSIQAFAPRGLPKLRKGLRTIRQTAATVTDVANEEFLERFRYIIVASQLLYDDPKPRRQSQDERTIELQPLSIRGAAITAGISFTIACVLHLLRRRYKTSQPLRWSGILTYTLLLLGGCALLIYFLRRQYLDFVRRSAGSTLGKAVKDWHNFDATATEALRFVQEVEIVSRGYEISQPLPPVSRLEDKSGASRCRELRAAIGSALMGSISHCVEAHNAIQPFVRDSDLQRYHDIYEVSMQEYLDSVTLANATTADAQNSLRELRFLFRLHLIARKVFLCDLLALHTESTWYNIAQWRKTLQLLQDLDLAIGHGTQDLHNAVIREEFGEKDHSITPQESNQSMERQTDTTTPQKQYGKAQMRRLEAVANSIRALNAKVHLIREELEQSAQGTSSIGLSMEVCRHYESLGSEIRHVLMEWEKGRNTVFLGAGGDSDNRRSSLMSNGIQSPGSPSPSSLGGLTVVDGGPAEAFRLLSGEDQGTPDGAAMDEEVFEAVALPRKRTSWAHLTREEKLSKMQEDRRKRATLLEHAENTTNMLRELQMVIKHRPNAVRSEKRVTSI
ncbi:hypothetical protein HRR83_000763 [Exophiala dermatitidis]|uniref:Vezatin n=1 Tax=Exophiala dermatitidis TaxID=5970 RepID=A0AAN6F5T2_EXODE|nr:hypothetical protein HRR75_000690 [Exophiala dermatitidis]KAJ4528012.1 hypothetical protein HRR74_000767 [Exophiala dermatitidis]KAJ4528645.1 hypothetical protein HRR73_001268 [Exophiala dermatitidis]KAJ4530022.1 hypothetical protein HRR76_009264 [Exophiala dermatitidis]KAJ4552987.1 hypothetical protein HRR78_003246 [Exophiala dermatitidis]